MLGTSVLMVHFWYSQNLLVMVHFWYSQIHDDHLRPSLKGRALPSILHVQSCMEDEAQVGICVCWVPLVGIHCGCIVLWTTHASLVDASRWSRELPLLICCRAPPS